MLWCVIYGPPCIAVEREHSNHTNYATYYWRAKINEKSFFGILES